MSINFPSVFRTESFGFCKTNEDIIKEISEWEDTKKYYKFGITEEYYRKSMRPIESCYQYGVYSNASGELLGEFVVQSKEKGERLIISRKVTPKKRGQGIGTQILREFIDYVRTLPDADKITIAATTGQDNTASRKSLAKLGFVQGGAYSSHELSLK